MKTQLAWIFGGGSVVALTFVTASGMTGCSGNPKTDGGGNDSGGQDVAQQDNYVPPNDAGDSGSCKSPPSLHAGTAGDLFCGYPNDAGVWVDAGSFTCGTSGSCDCNPGNICCLGGSAGGGQYYPEQCAPWADGIDAGVGACAANKGLPIECEQTSDCTSNGAPTGSICCLTGNPSAPAPSPTNCTADLKSSGGTGIVCTLPSDGGVTAGQCPNSGDLQVCETQGECTGGKTCTAIRWKLYEIGVCL